MLRASRYFREFTFGAGVAATPIPGRVPVSAPSGPPVPRSRSPLLPFVQLRCGNGPDLAQHAQLVEVVPRLRDPAALDPLDRDARKLHAVAAGRYAEQIPLVGAD